MKEYRIKEPKLQITKVVSCDDPHIEYELVSPEEYERRKKINERDERTSS